jgi:AcrR family transcriptional regulator
LFVTNTFVTIAFVPPTSRRDRPAKPALSREGIVRAALAVLRAEGLEKVTMRRLAQDLDTGPASLYVYVANTAELHALVLDELLGAVGLDGDVEQVLTTYVEVLFAHPALARSALVARPSGPHYLALVERLLGLLAEAGVAPDRAAWGVDLLLQYATATAAEQSTRARDVAAEDDWAALNRVVDAVHAGTHPHIAASADHLLSGTGPARLSWGFRVLLAGIAGTPTEEP